MVEAWLTGRLAGMPRIIEWLPIADALLGTNIMTLRKSWWKDSRLVQYTRVLTTRQLRDRLRVRVRLFGLRVWRVLNALVVWFLVSGAKVDRSCLLKVKITKQMAAEGFRAYAKKQATLRLEKRGRPDIRVDKLDFPSVYKHQVKRNASLTRKNNEQSLGLR